MLSLNVTALLPLNVTAFESENGGGNAVTGLTGSNTRARAASEPDGPMAWQEEA